MEAGEIILSGRGLSKEYLRNGAGTNVFYAVKNVDIGLRAGNITLVRGRSGSGKTTLLHILSGILPPSAGEVSFHGESIYDKAEEELARFRNIHFGMIPQGQSAIGSLTVLENVLLPYSLYNEEDDKREKARTLLERLGILALSDVMPSELSGGELRRMAIARAMIRQPEVIFADEPTGDLDDENTAEVFALLRQAASDGAAVLLVTHEPDAEEYADVVYKMDAGEMVGEY